VVEELFKAGAALLLGQCTQIGVGVGGEQVEGHQGCRRAGFGAAGPAVEEGVPAPTLATALYSRFDSRGLDRFANQVLSAMRKGFGGHAEKPGRSDDAGTVRP
jgi:6-phosphogluconate dehydrogenase (decarboxylating)